MPKVLLFNCLRGPWIRKRKPQFLGSHVPPLVIDSDGYTVAAFLSHMPERSGELVQAAVEKLPDALSFLQEFADAAHDTRESVDGRFFCLWCGADLGFRARSTGEPDDMPDAPICTDPNCTGNAARALLAELEAIVTERIDSESNSDHASPRP